ncbi:MAG: hypothetical protein E6J29_01800, partial [Chloroflexi bacterium]
ACPPSQARRPRGRASRRGCPRRETRWPRPANLAGRAREPRHPGPGRRPPSGGRPAQTRSRGGAHS